MPTNDSNFHRWKQRCITWIKCPQSGKARFVRDSWTLTSSGVKSCEQVTCLMSCSWSKKLRPPRRAVPKEIRHRLDYSLYPDVCSLLLYLMCQVKVFCFFFKSERGRERGGNPGEKGGKFLLDALYHLSGADCWRITFLALSPLFGNSLTSPSLYLCLAFSVFPFSFGCIHFTVIHLSLKSPSLFAPSSLPALSFYLSRNNGGGTGPLAHHVGARGLDDITLIGCHFQAFQLVNTLELKV